MGNSNDDLWALAQDQKTRKQLSGINPAFTRYIDANRSLPNVGYAVAYAATQDSYGRAGLDRAIVHARGHDGIVGGWYNPQNGRYYFDSVRIYQTRDAAIRAAIRERQIGIYNLSTNQYMDVMDETSGSFLVPDRRKRRFSLP